MENVFRLFEGLPRLGPGSEASTLRALAMLPGLPPEPRVLDLGCGTGASTLILAQQTGGLVTAVDVHPPFLDEVARRAAAAGLARSIETRCQSIDALDDLPASYDLIWSEGAIYNIGFERGLRLWRPQPNGCVCVTEATWLTSDPPAEARDYWAAGYPEMGTIDGNLERARSAGYESLGAFPLPRSDWELEYYRPLQARIAELRGDPALSPIIEETEREIELFHRHGDAYGYVFYLLRATST